MKSFSEIDIISKRASRALGYSWGISEEIGKNIRLLEMFGLNGIKNFNAYCSVFKKRKFQNISLIAKKNYSKPSSFCPITTGVNFLDQIRIVEKLNKIKLDKIIHPLLILPFLSRSSEIIGKKIHIKFDQYEFLLNFNVNISSNLLNKDYPKITNKVEINILENVDNFTNQDWNNLYKISEKTFVEETDSSKQVAAGAGLTDND